MLSFIRRLFSLLGSAIGLAFFVLLLSPLIGPPMYVEVAGPVVSGTVEAKHEAIDVFSGTWMRRAFVDVRYRPRGEDEPEVTGVAVDVPTYDRLHPGDAVRVRYAPNQTLRQIGGIEIEYDCGYADEATDLPVALRLAIMQIVASLYELRQGEGGIPETARALMRPFAPARL